MERRVPAVSIDPCLLCRAPNSKQDGNVPCQRIVLECSGQFCLTCLERLIQAAKSSGYHVRCAQVPKTPKASKSCLQRNGEAPSITLNNPDIGIEEIYGVNLPDKLPSPNLTLNQSVTAKVCFWISPSNFFVQLYPNDVDNIQRDLIDLVENNTSHQVIDVVEPGMFLAVRSVIDRNIYRAKVVSVTKELEKVKVRYVDFGNTEDVSMESTWPMTDKLSDYPIQSVECFLNLKNPITSWPEDVSEAFFLMIKDDKMSMVISDIEESSGKAAVNITLRGNKNFNAEVESYFSHQMRQDSSDCDGPSRSSEVVRTEPMPSLDLGSPVPPKSYSLVVTHVESPDAIYVRLKHLDNLWEAFNLQIQKILSSEQNYGLHQLHMGQIVGVNDQGHYFRGTVTSIKNREYQVFLLDKGPIICTSKRYLTPLPKQLKRTNAFCVRVKLAGLTPLGTSDQSWSITAKEKFCDYMKPIICVEGYPVGEIDEKVKQIEMDLTYEVIEMEDAFEPAVAKTISIKTFLHEKGFAMLANPSALSNNTAKSTNLTLSSCGSVAIQDDLGENFSEDRPIQVLTGSDQSPGKPMWPSPIMIEERVFDAKVTFIDTEGQIYVQTQEQQNMAQDLTQCLEAFVQNLDEREIALDQEKLWNVGDIGIAPYPQADLVPGWFRFVVFEINKENDNEAAVCFVDYGEHKELDLRTVISRFPKKAMEIPILALRCKLAKIVPIDSFYPTEFLNAVHAEIVEKDVTIKVAKKGSTFPIPAVIKLKINNDLEINLARDFKNRGQAWPATEELWYDSKAIQRQEKIALYIQPTTMERN
ncbi:RING finger protein 17-like isoform X2 [Tigriopus californicus]|uniref:RING finger protein 17-like isoform X2 n=1 Tax=Tigriopus californicus TaxID=6832 RepID=UPI0027D9E446|nr:RING finger protein 17-like isoform X2 [Tigriopus californicus]